MIISTTEHITEDDALKINLIYTIKHHRNL